MIHENVTNHGLKSVNLTMIHGLSEFMHVSAMTVQLWCNDARNELFA